MQQLFGLKILRGERGRSGEVREERDGDAQGGNFQQLHIEIRPQKRTRRRGDHRSVCR